MSAAPNLFDFATSELSQDAFLCWLIAHADCAARPAMKLAAQTFIAFLWDASGRGTIAPADIQLRERPKRQVDNIDIIFEADVGDAKAVFVIEDKTDTSHHSDQLAHYSARVESTHQSHERVLIYLKTGFHFGEDEKARQHGYAVVGLREILSCLRSQQVESEIYADYLQRAERMLVERDDAIAKLRAPRGHEALVRDFVQYTFVSELAARCPENIGGLELRRGHSIGGAPWTHVQFVRHTAVYSGNIGEVLFHRVDGRQDDSGKRRFYLSTRQYAVVKENADARAAKKVRLARLRELFKLARHGSSLQFATPTTDNAGANESEIAVLFFDESTNAVDAVLAGMPAVHAAFVALVQKEFGP